MVKALHKELPKKDYSLRSQGILTKTKETLQKRITTTHHLCHHGTSLKITTIIIRQPSSLNNSQKLQRNKKSLSLRIRLLLKRRPLQRRRLPRKTKMLVNSSSRCREWEQEDKKNTLLKM
jgi:hypothetical protein